MPPDGEEMGFRVNKYLAFLLPGRITAAFLFSLKKGVALEQDSAIIF